MVLKQLSAAVVMSSLINQTQTLRVRINYNNFTSCPIFTQDITRENCCHVVLMRISYVMY
jgi:hypothetical protein